MQQGALPLKWQERFGLDDFIVAPCDAEAFWAMQNPDKWPFPVLLLVGPASSGKTHLAHIFQSLHGAEFINVNQNPLPEAHSGNSFMIIDGVDRLLNSMPLAAENVFHIVNDVMLQKGRLLLTASSPAVFWVVLPDLLSRLQASYQVNLEPPDEKMIQSAYQKLFVDRGLFVDDKVLNYLGLRSGRSFAEIRQNVEIPDRLALEQGRKVTIPLIQQAAIFTS